MFKWVYEIVKLLLNDTRVNPSDQDNEALRNASARGHFEIVKLLISNPKLTFSDISSDAIVQASKNGHLEIVKLLLNDPRVNPTYQNNAAVRYANTFKFTDIVNLLLTDTRVSSHTQNELSTYLNGNRELLAMILPKTDKKSPTFSWNLPTNRTIDIFTKLHPSECLALSTVSKTWQSTSSDPILWRKYCSTTAPALTHFLQELKIPLNVKLLFWIFKKLKFSMNREEATKIVKTIPKTFDKVEETTRAVFEIIQENTMN